MVIHSSAGLLALSWVLDTLTGRFVTYWLLVPVGPPFAFRSMLILQNRFKRCWKLSSESLVHIDIITSHNLPFHLIPKVLYWIELWWLWKSFECSELAVMFKKQVWDYLNFLTWSVKMATLVIKGLTSSIKSWPNQTGKSWIHLVLGLFPLLPTRLGTTRSSLLKSTS